MEYNPLYERTKQAMAKYVNFRDKTISEDINTIFPNWEPGNERVAIFSPHDDDAMIGAGYVIETVQKNGGEIVILIFCNGDCGYSSLDLKDTIVDIRKKETIEAYKYLGITEKNIVYMNLDDFSAWDRIGYRLSGGDFGSLPDIFRQLRGHDITRVLIPNGHREHVDHEAVYRMGAYDSVQACDPVLVECGEPCNIKSFLQYSVWADFSPEDALVDGAASDIRANRAIILPKESEENLYEALFKYKSQYNAIKNLIKDRAERLSNLGYVELYISFDARPKLNFAPYIDIINNI